MFYLSIILPIYNVEKELPKCMQSILSQTVSDCELILVDDGSTDASGRIADSYVSENVQVIHKPNGGLASARAEGLRRAAGEYVWFVDSDDAVEPDCLEDILDTLHSTRADIFRFGFRCITGERVQTVYEPYPEKVYSGPELEALRHKVFGSIGQSFLTAWMHIYRRELITNLPMPSERLVGSEDDVFNVIAYQKAESICCCDEVWYRYYLRPGSLSRTPKPILRRHINAYLSLKDALTQTGTWEIYRGELSHAFLHTVLLGGGRGRQGSIFKEYAWNRDNPHETVAEILNSAALREMLETTKEITLPPVLAELITILQAGDEPALFRYIGQLAMNP